MWDTFFSTFEIRGTIAYPQIATRELDAYEQEIKLPLPKSYREFCLKFGPGQIVFPMKYDIAAPCLNCRENYSESRYLNQMAKDSNSGVVDEYSADASDVSRLSRAIYFGSDSVMQFYFWDQAEVASTEDSEYAVYVIQRLGDIKRIADSFHEFITVSCLVRGTPGYASNIERQRIFVPADIPVEAD